MTKGKILVVEDEQIIAKDLKFTLESLGYSVAAIVATGLDAVKFAEMHKPDIILMDIQLKGQMDGIEAAGKINERCCIPIVYLTAFADNNIIQRAKITEPFGYIVKPFQEKELHSVIEMALYRSKSDKEKASLKEQIVKLTRKIQLTDNEKKVFYGMTRHPMFNDIELSKVLRIKRSTVTAIKNKLYYEKYVQKYRMPHFPSIDCELLTVIYGKFSKVQLNPGEWASRLKEIFSAPEQIWLVSTDKDFFGVCISRNLTDLKKYLDSAVVKLKEIDLTGTIHSVFFPFDTSSYELLNYSPYLKKRLELESQEGKIKGVKPQKRKLTNKEKVIFYALTKFPGLNDSEISQSTPLPRPSISQTKRRLINDGLITVLHVPDLIKTRGELLVFRHVAFPDLSRVEFASFINNTGHNLFFALSGSEACYVNAYEDYTEFEMKGKQEEKFLSENNMVALSTSILSLPMVTYENIQFHELVRKIFSLKVKF